VRESLIKMQDNCDVVIVSAAAHEALTREWSEHQLDQYVKVIAGQEMGTKQECIEAAKTGRYAGNHVLMIGDALGDMKAARANNALFYPINPGAEDESWKKFHDEAYSKFIKGEYAGKYEDELIDRFEACLPATPHWK
jgi:phosphoglycolate phosphatase-like HAD superfamily hydrolase